MAETITPRHYLSDTPPPRIIGVECEYNLQPPPEDPSLEKQLKQADYIKTPHINSAGLISADGFLSNGGRLYPDVGGHLEYDTPECLGSEQAAAADLAGIIVMQRIITASGLPHRGLFRLSGSFLPSTLNQTTQGTSGYHENFMTPRSVTEEELAHGLLPAHLASKVWSMGGTLHEQYVFSQKVWDIGGTPLSSDMNRRTKRGAKPMVMIPSANSDEDTIGNEAWARFEVRFADVGQSPTARFVNLASTSLVIRLLEHSERVGTKSLEAIRLKDPIEAAKLFAGDLSLRKTVELVDGRKVTALDVGNYIVDKCFELSAEVALPDDEIRGLMIWADILDELALARPDKAEYGELENMLDVALKHTTLIGNRHPTLLQGTNPQDLTRNLKWDCVLPHVVKPSRWHQDPRGEIFKETIEDLTKNPPCTRAQQRAEYITAPNQKIKHINWAQVKLENRDAVKLSDPYGD